MAWDYAELSKAAKKAGGPEKLVELIEQGGKAIGRAEGRSSMLPWLGVVGIGASVFTATVIKIGDHLREKESISQEAVDQAKTELVQGIKDYDAAHMKKAKENEEECNPEDGCSQNTEEK